MKFSAKFEYALLVLLYLQCEPDEEPISGRELSEKLSLPYRFLEQILGDLKKGGLVRSVRGNKGGYQLSSGPERISVYDIYQVTEGKVEPWDCGAAEGADRCGKDHNLCVVSHFYAGFKETMINYMKGYTLGHLCQSAQSLKAAGAAQPLEQAVANLGGNA